MKNPIELTQSSLLEAPSEIIASNLTMGEGVKISDIDENNSLCKLAFKLFENTRSYHPAPRLPGEVSWAEATEQEKFKAREDARIKSAREVMIFQDGQFKVEASERLRLVHGRYTLEEAVTLIKIKELGRINVIKTLRSLCIRIASKKMQHFDPDMVSEKNECFSIISWKDEVYWDDLNKWLEEDMPRIVYRFPNPKETKDLGSRVVSPAIKLREEHKAQALTLGEEYLKEWRRAKYEPTIANVGSYIEAVFSYPDKGIYNEKGELYRAASIIRKYLTGITGHSKGYRSKKPKIPPNKVQRLPTDDDFK